MEFEHHDLLRSLLHNRFKMFLNRGELHEAENMIELTGRLGYFDLKQTMLVLWDTYKLQSITEFKGNNRNIK